MIFLTEMTGGPVMGRTWTRLCLAASFFVILPASALAATPSAGPWNGVATNLPAVIVGSNFDYGSFHFPLAGVEMTSVYRPDAGNANLKPNTDSTTTNPWVVGTLATGSYLAYTVNVAATATYAIQVRAESNGGGRFHLEVDGTPVTGSVVVPSTGNWNQASSWKPVAATGKLTLNAGTHTVRIVADAQFFDLNTVEFVSGTNGQYSVNGHVYGLANPPTDARLAAQGPPQVVHSGNTEIWVAPRTDGVPGSGTAADPYDVSTAAKFDPLVQSKGTNFTWHLAKGRYLMTPGNTAKVNMQYFGAGMDQTILAPARQGPCISGDFGFNANGFQCFDLTIDCNNGTYSEGTALNLQGNHVLIERVHAIHWATLMGSECFVFFSFGSPSQAGVTWTDHVYDRCIFDQPLTNGPAQDGNTIASMFAAQGQGQFDATCKITHCIAGPNIAQYFLYSHAFEAPEVAYNTVDGVQVGIYDEPEAWGNPPSYVDATSHNWHDNVFKNVYCGYCCNFTKANGKMTGNNVFQNNTVDNRSYSGHNCLAKINYNYSSVPYSGPSLATLKFMNNTYLGQMGGSDVPLDINPNATNGCMRYGTLTIQNNTISYGTSAGAAIRVRSANVTSLSVTGNTVNGVSNNSFANQ